MTRPKLLAAPVRREYDRLAREIIAGTVLEMASELDGRYRHTLDAFAKALDGTSYPGGSSETGINPAHARQLAVAGRRLVGVRRTLGELAGVLRAVAVGVHPGASRYVA